MDTEIKHQCKNCKGTFFEWRYEFKCQNCDDGITDNVRDIDFNGTGYCTCHVCKGTGEESTAETEFCCVECIEEHSDEHFN